MYIRDNIAYAGEAPQLLKVVEAKPENDYTLNLTFNNGIKKTFDFANLLKIACYKPLEDKETFRTLTIEHGVLVWLDGEIDISPEYLFENAI